MPHSVVQRFHLCRVMERILSSVRGNVHYVSILCSFGDFSQHFFFHSWFHEADCLMKLHDYSVWNPHLAYQLHSNISFIIYINILSCTTSYSKGVNSQYSWYKSKAMTLRIAFIRINFTHLKIVSKSQGNGSLFKSVYLNKFLNAVKFLKSMDRAGKLSHCLATYCL